ncbi:hypothetical protein Dsin_000013 [Dipteronia sinensis]|uniref:Uncharacterized protein n=1 Tax=Dipteronia sinensis TaxID=43782 RepID=A0AAD9Z052_9ROSI|nr:hypothetical protein Dsin_000013 [Dipteronia sinensis]
MQSPACNMELASLVTNRQSNFSVGLTQQMRNIIDKAFTKYSTQYQTRKFIQQGIPPFMMKDNHQANQHLYHLIYCIKNFTNPLKINPIRMCLLLKLIITSKILMTPKLNQSSKGDDTKFV